MSSSQFSSQKIEPIGLALTSSPSSSAKTTASIKLNPKASNFCPNEPMPIHPIFNPHPERNDPFSSGFVFDKAESPPFHPMFNPRPERNDQFSYGFVLNEVNPTPFHPLFNPQM